MSRFRMLLVTLVVVVAAFATIASGEENKAEKVGDTGTAAAGDTPASGAETFGVGQEVKLGDWTVIAHGVTDPQPAPNEFLQPTAGTRWVAVDTEVKNLSDSPENVSSLLCFELKDSLNRSYDISIVSGVEPGPPDGEVEPGGALRGTAVFEVPADAAGLQFRFKCDLFSEGTAIIQLT